MPFDNYSTHAAALKLARRWTVKKRERFGPSSKLQVRRHFKYWTTQSLACEDPSDRMCYAISRSTCDLSVECFVSLNDSSLTLRKQEDLYNDLQPPQYDPSECAEIAQHLVHLHSLPRTYEV